MRLSSAFIVPALLIAAAGMSPARAQQRHDSSAPIDFDARSLQLDDKANRGILTGNVVVRQAEMTLGAARVTVAYTGAVIGGSPQVSRLDASGGVTVRRPNQTAKSQYAIYDINRRVITMLGAVSLTQAGNTVNGARLTLNLDTGRAVIDGSSVGSAGAGASDAGTGATIRRGSGRVSGTFSVPQRN